MIPYSRQSVSEEDIQAVIDVLRSDFLTQGDQVPGFEQAICDYTGAANAVAVNSGTSALHLACLALGLGQGDWLWTSAVTFVASANCGLYCGAQVDFVDIDPQTLNMDAQQLAHKLELAEQEGRLPKVVVVVHMAGLPAELEAIHALANQYGFSVIEDASHALGASYQGQPIGNCRFSDITVFSFHPVKSITTGEGGMAVCNHAELAEKMCLLRTHGITRDPADMDQKPEGGWYYQQRALGFNYRLSDLHAALGISQLRRLDQFIDRRRQVAESYQQTLADLPLQLPVWPQQVQSAWHLYPVQLTDQATVSRRELYDHLRDTGIGVNVHYIPVHLQPVYRAMGFAEGDFPQAENCYRRILSLPCYPSLQAAQQKQVVARLTEILAA